MRYSTRQYAQALYAALRESFAKAGKAGEQRVLKRFSEELRRQRKTRLIPRILEEVDRLHHAAEGSVRLVCTTAKPLSHAGQEHLVREFTKRLGKRVLLDVNVQEDLIGGAQFRYDDTVVDASSALALKQLHQQLTA